MIKFNGFKEVHEKINDLKRRVERLDGERAVAIDELLTTAFLNNCSEFSSVDELFRNSGYKVEPRNDFAAVPDDKWDEFIKTNTNYENWQEMLKAATTVWVRLQLDL